MTGRYPAAAIESAIEALELSYSYLRTEPFLEQRIEEALQRLYRARELHDEAKPNG